MKLKVILLTILLSTLCSSERQKPNIVIIQADDLGWNDVSFHGSSEIPTPNIDYIAYSGVILNRFYTPPLCTPSRSSFMTGKYSTRLGMSHFVIPSDEPWALPINEKLISQYFKEAGYKTALVGKWHLGFYQKQYTPTQRGFDTHIGYLGPYIGYFDYSLKMHDRNFSRGYDMRRNLSVNYDTHPKQYVTNFFTDEAVKLITYHNKVDPLFLVVNHLAPHAGNEFPDNPLEAPEEEIEKFKHIVDPQRRILAAMISVMDQGVGKIITAIKEKGIMDNTIIMFLSDNGGPTRGLHSTKASNHPLRGQKGSVWEGGCRVAACIYSPLLKSPKRVSNDFMYVTDILPTLAGVANITINDNSIDGVNQWEMISTGAPSARKELLYNIENVYGFSAIMSEGWKLVNGSENIKNADWFGSSGQDNVNVSFKSYIKDVLEAEASKSLPALKLDIVKALRKQATVKCTENFEGIKSNPLCNPLVAPCLFNLIDDPCEMHNLAESQPIKLKYLISRLNKHVKDTVPSIRRPSDPKCDPKNFNNTWTFWQEDGTENLNKVDENSQSYFIYFLCSISMIIALSTFFAVCRHERKSMKF